MSIALKPRENPSEEFIITGLKIFKISLGLYQIRGAKNPERPLGLSGFFCLNTTPTQ